MNLASSRFTGVTLEGVISPQEGFARTKLPCILLHVKKTSTPVKMYRVREKAKIMEAAFHRFLLFAEAGSERVFGMFTSNDTETSQLLRFSPNLHPGATCLLLNPRHRDEKYLQDSDNALLTTAEPLVPIFLEDASTVLPKYSPKMADFQHFCFNTVTLEVLSVCTVSHLCSGKFCDGQTLKDACGCKETDLKKHSWGVTLELICDELKGERVGFLSVYFTSKRVVSLFTDSYSSLTPDTDNFDEFDFEDAVLKCVKHLNENGGFRVHGWLKPSTAAVAVGSNNSPLHVVSVDVIQPSTLTTNAYKDLQFRATERIVVQDTPGTVQGGYVVPRPRTPPSTSHQQDSTSSAVDARTSSATLVSPGLPAGTTNNNIDVAGTANAEAIGSAGNA